MHLGEGEGDSRTPPALGAKTRSARFETRSYRAESKALTARTAAVLSKRQVQLSAGSSGLRRPRDKGKPSPGAESFPTPAAGWLGRRARRDRTGLTPGRDAVQRWEGGSGKARVEPGAGSAPKNASDPPPNPARASPKRPHALLGFGARVCS